MLQVYPPFFLQKWSWGFQSYRLSLVSSRVSLHGSRVIFWNAIARWAWTSSKWFWTTSRYTWNHLGWTSMALPSVSFKPLESKNHLEITETNWYENHIIPHSAPKQTTISPLPTFVIRPSLLLAHLVFTLYLALCFYFRLPVFISISHCFYLSSFFHNFYVFRYPFVSLF